MRNIVGAAIIAVLIVGLGTITPAAAGSRVISDPVGDIRHGMDIKRVSIRYGKALVITVRHRDAYRYGTVGAYIDINRRDDRPNFLMGRDPGGMRYSLWMKSWRYQGGPWGCRGLRVRTDIAEDRSVIRVPHLCLSGASFQAKGVRVSVFAGAHHRATDYAPGHRRWSAWVRRG